jgi:hypothetical protein
VLDLLNRLGVDNRLAVEENHIIPVGANLSLSGKPHTPTKSMLVLHLPSNEKFVKWHLDVPFWRSLVLLCPHKGPVFEFCTCTRFTANLKVLRDTPDEAIYSTGIW